MAKKSRKCRNPRCLFCGWWPKVGKSMGKSGGCYWVDTHTGEVFIASGLRLLPGGELVEIPSGEAQTFYEVECDCGETGFVRGDVLQKCLCDRCPECAAQLSNTMRN